MERGEIWRVVLDPIVGHEQQGDRPVIIVSPKPFNDATGTPIVLPVTTGGAFARRHGFAISLEGTGTRTVGVVRCDQPRALDLTARNGSRIETAPTEFVEELLARLRAILE
ncbi:MAG: type II toxin-antitoxin system PemK/MazF family toxin [Gammaproteobacteria bacterium]|nr:type II toxin-antitoxin system PemK/MazF family toxin [Gammaproteobacteria bacterium]